MSDRNVSPPPPQHAAIDGGGGRPTATPLNNGLLNSGASTGAAGALDWKSSTSPPNSRKRKAGIGSRGVANLTPEQLEKKRANDREAQRAIRERTKIQIETLEARIRELTSTQPYQEIQNILRQKELVELENADIKRRLAAVIDLIQPILANNSVAESQRASIEGILDNSSVNGHTNIESIPAENNAAAMGLSETNTSKSSPGSWHMASHSSDMASRRTSVSGNKRGSFSGGIPGLLRRTSEDNRELGLLSEVHNHGHSSENNTSSSNQPSLPADHHITLSSPIALSHRTPPNSSNTRGQPWQTIPPWGPSSSVFDNLLLEFILDAQRRRAQGLAEFELIGPLYPNFAAIAYPQHDIPCHPMSRFLRDILVPFPDVTIIANKVAIAYIMFLILRWHISPTPESFDRLPHWCHPNAWQLTVTHSLWIDYVPWPDMRGEMVRSPHLYPFDRFFVPHTKTESINWDHGENAMFVRAEAPEDADGGQVLSHAYESHIRDLDNWTLGPAFAKEFPLLAASCRITTRGEDERRNLAEKMKRHAAAAAAAGAVGVAEGDRR